jgi:glutamate/tyrosine decarboxylase-like PLP-dependent enzyme
MSDAQIEERKNDFPKRGTPWETLQRELEAFKADDFDWRKGRVPSYTYFYNDATLEVQKKAYMAFISENALGASRAFKSLSRMLDDIYRMGLSLFHAPKGAGASFTSGGTESVFMALKTARDHARASRNNQAGRLNVVTGYASHLCLDKAAHILDIEVRRTPVGPEYRMDIEAVEQAIDENTIMIYASAPNYPYGVFDPISDLGRLSQSRGLWLHVDGCWGGFISPFAKKLGYPIPDWDFIVPGVTSISADIHKFGYGAKGASLILYRDKALQEFEKFEFSNWPRGTYATPTFMGTKPGGSVASAWAVMRYLGEDGYMAATRETMDATRMLIDGINKIPGLKCLTPTGESNLFAYIPTDPSIDIMAVADRLEERGWFRGRMREPLGIQQGVNPAHLPVVDEYIQAVKDAIEYTRRNRTNGQYDERSY